MPETHKSGLESDFDRLLSIVNRSKLFLFLCAVVGTLVGGGSSFLFAPMYKADAVLMVTEDVLGVGQGNSISGGLGGFAALVGLGAAEKKRNEAIPTLTSRILTMQYIRDHDLLPVLFFRRWDLSTKKWKVSEKDIPDLEDGYRLFDKSVRAVVENHKTGLINISVTWRDPKLACEWVQGIVDYANESLRKQAIERSQRNLDYLRKVADTTSVVEVKETLNKLVENELKKQMVAAGERDYAFRILDPPIVSEKKVSPKRLVFAIVGAAGFFFVGLVFASGSRFRE